VRALSLELHEEVGVGSDAAARVGVELHGVRLGVDDVDARRAQAGDDEVAPFVVVVVVVVVAGVAVGLDVAEAGAAGVPAEVVELVAPVWVMSTRPTILP
jgi:hypothetical protein